jgi:hypothetical protein
MKQQGLILIFILSIMSFNAFARDCDETEKNYIAERCSHECDALSSKEIKEGKIQQNQKYIFSGKMNTIQCADSGALLGTCTCKLQ